MITNKEITNYFINKGFETKQFKNLSKIGLQAFYKREESGYTPQMLTEDEFFDLYAVHSSNLGSDRSILSGEQLQEGLTAGWVAEVPELSPRWSYSQGNYSVGHQIILVPWPYVTTSLPAKIQPGYKPKKEEVSIITEDVNIKFHGYDHNGIAFPWGIDFLKLFNVGSALVTI